MNPFEVLADPVRRQILEVLANGEKSAGAIATAVIGKFGITQAAVSQHLRVLRENGFAQMRADGARHLYSVEVTGFREADEWFARFRSMWEPRLNALAKEVARGKAERAKRPGT